MKLIGSLTSPYVRKVRVVLAEKKLDYRFEIEDPWSDATTISEFNPLGKVPCLIMEDGGAVFDSRVIVEHLDGLSPFARLIPQNGRPRIEVRTWEAIADGICDAAVGARLEGNRPAEQRSATYLTRQFRKVDDSLAAMDNALGDKGWCVGMSITLADIAATAALSYLDFRFAQIDWRTRHPALGRHYDKIVQRPSFVDTAFPTA
jgi:glutathione S-transferase